VRATYYQKFQAVFLLWHRHNVRNACSQPSTQIHAAELRPDAGRPSFRIIVQLQEALFGHLNSATPEAIEVEVECPAAVPKIWHSGSQWILDSIFPEDVAIQLLRIAKWLRYPTKIPRFMSSRGCLQYSCLRTDSQRQIRATILAPSLLILMADPNSVSMVRLPRGLYIAYGTRTWEQL
jgi:hypothetical protein